MRVQQAKEVARQWVLAAADQIPGFSGAFYHGSVNGLRDEAILPATSDVDIMVVLADPDSVDKLGKFHYRDVLLEVSYLPADQVWSAERVLGQYHLAGSFRTASIIADPTGQLTSVQAAVAKDFAQRRWVYTRCEQARDKVLNNLAGVSETAPFHDQVMPWLFATGVTTHVLLVAGLRNPTVRRRYMAVQELLTEYGHAAFYTDLLELLGCAGMRREQVAQHLAAMTEAFDAAKIMVKSPFFFASDLSDLARPIAIDGSRELIARGSHREAVFWLAATYSRCQKVFDQDAPVEMRDRFSPGYRRLLGDLGIHGFADLQQRSDQVQELLPRVWDVAEAIIAANAEIEDEPQPSA